MFNDSRYAKPLNQVLETEDYKRGALASSGEFCAMIRDMGDVIAAEVGVAFGINSIFMLENCPNIKHYYAIDPHEAYQDWGPDCGYGNMQHDLMVAVGNKFLENLEAYDNKDKITFYKKTSDEAKDLIPANTLNFMFIDANHSTESVRQDCLNWWPKMKKGGIMAGHDFDATSVQEGVKRFMDEMNISSDRLIRVDHPQTHIPCWMIKVL
jgi:predicted O-methyltransferase YrrM